MKKWTGAAIAIAVAFVLAGIVRRVIVRRLDNEKRSESIRSSAAAVVLENPTRVRRPEHPDA